MGVCGCGEYIPSMQYAIRGCVVGIVVYPGCDYCEDMIGVDPYFYTKGSEFIVDHETRKVTPDEYGGEGSAAIPIFAVQDIREAAKRIGDPIHPGDEDSCQTLDEWLDEYGLQLLQDAIRICAARIKKERADRENQRQEDAGTQEEVAPVEN